MKVKERSESLNQLILICILRIGFVNGLVDRFTVWLFNIAVENGPFIDDFPIKTSIYKGFSMAMLNNQMAHDFT